MCYACKYPREFKVGDIVKINGGKVEILKTNIDRAESDPERKWYRVKVLVEHDDNRIMDFPCNTLCHVSPEGNKRIYSRLYNCPNCKKLVRFSYPEDISFQGHWECPECDFKLAFAFYDLKEDETYRPGDVHELKTLPGYFMALVGNRKTFEVRKNDRNFKEGDILVLKEWSQQDGYSGREYRREITYILNNSDYCKDGYVILGIKPIG